MVEGFVIGVDQIYHANEKRSIIFLALTVITHRRFVLTLIGYAQTGVIHAKVIDAKTGKVL